MIRLILRKFPCLYFFPLLLVGSGCIRPPNDEALSLMQQTPALDETLTKALASHHFTTGDFPNSNWWKTLEDPNLDHLIEIALAQNPSLQEVMYRLKKAEEEAKIKKAALFPTLNGDGSINWQYISKYNFFRAYTPVIPPSVAEYALGFDFSYEFDFWGRQRNLYLGALGLAKEKEAELYQTKLTLSAAIATLYIQLQANEEKLSLLKQEQTLLTHILNLTTLKKEKALDNDLSLIVSDNDLLIVKQMIIHLQEHNQLLHNGLCELAGQGPDASLPLVKTALPHFHTLALPKDLSANLLSQRADLMAARWHVEAFTHFVAAAKADFYPNINLAALAGIDSVFFKKLFSWSARNGSMKPAFSLPLFTAGRLKAHLKSKEAEFHQAITTYNATLLRAVKEVADQITTINALSTQIDIKEHVVSNDTRKAKLYQLRHNHGISSLIPLLHAEEALVREKAELVDLQAKRELSMILLIKALGGGYHYSQDPLALLEKKETICG